MTTITIYALLDPRGEGIDVRYVGFTTRYPFLRYMEHTDIRNNRSKDGRRITAKEAWIIELADVGMLPTLIALETISSHERKHRGSACICPDCKKAKHAEKVWMNRFAFPHKLTNSRKSRWIKRDWSKSPNGL